MAYPVYQGGDSPGKRVRLMEGGGIVSRSGDDNVKRLTRLTRLHQRLDSRLHFGTKGTNRGVDSSGRPMWGWGRGRVGSDGM
jgi:hypothetical protein